MKKTKTSPAFSNAFLDQLLSGYETPGDWNQVQYQLDSLKSALVERLEIYPKVVYGVKYKAAYS